MTSASTCPDCGAMEWGNATCSTCRSHWPGGDPSAATSRDQTVPVPRCEYCGPLQWTIDRWDRETHKCGCPYRINTYCQAHPVICDEWTDIRNEAWRRDT